MLVRGILFIASGDMEMMVIERLLGDLPSRPGVCVPSPPKTPPQSSTTSNLPPPPTSTSLQILINIHLKDQIRIKCQNSRGESQSVGGGGVSYEKGASHESFLGISMSFRLGVISISLHFPSINKKMTPLLLWEERGPSGILYLARPAHTEAVFSPRGIWCDFPPKTNTVRI